MPRIDSTTLLLCQAQITEFISRSTITTSIETAIVRVIIFSTQHRRNVVLFSQLLVIVQHCIVSLLACIVMRIIRTTSSIVSIDTIKDILIEIILSIICNKQSTADLQFQTVNDIEYERLVQVQLASIIIAVESSFVNIVWNIRQVPTYTGQIFTLFVCSTECRRQRKRTAKVIFHSHTAPTYFLITVINIIPLSISIRNRSLRSQPLTNLIVSI